MPCAKRRRVSTDVTIATARDLMTLFELDGETRLDLEEYAEELAAPDIDGDGLPRAGELVPLVDLFVTVWPRGPRRPGGED